MTDELSDRIAAKRAEIEANGPLFPDDRAAVDREAAEAVLVAHQATSTSGCICGGVELGRSHPRHVIDELIAAGVFRDADEVRRERHTP